VLSNLNFDGQVLLHEIALSQFTTNLAPTADVGALAREVVEHLLLTE
jgi:hypothetical protein